MYTHITAKDLKEGDLVIHNRIMVEILAIEIIDNWIINCCTIDGGRISFSVDSRVKKISKKNRK
ncbi:hypothetical protein [Aeromonas phage 4L372D]|uniref:Uncharacterized protein n=1 Tax=Aeromonas phage 4L372D TaxID=2588518 RepID=A0A5B9N903_9CAUD|nr:hypothetical protein HWC27_gp011 [Aeromonas phage 4L372D]YP_009846584.1 hypothetical protein HWC27_gp036 [Aeromonas phage 4L372D]QEG08475.1 hypothetical protein [Aeromonas phage 4L372D]QEG08500.1 hypothetical protein [Aeromonas phage 4L372D]